MNGTGQGIHADAAPRAVGNYPHARRVGGLLFLSGIGPRDPATNDIAGNEYFADGRVRRYDITAQARAVFVAEQRRASDADAEHALRLGGEQVLVPWIGGQGPTPSSVDTKLNA